MHIMLVAHKCNCHSMMLHPLGKCVSQIDGSLLDDSKYVNVTGLLYLCGGWLVCVEYLNCYGC